MFYVDLCFDMSSQVVGENATAVVDTLSPVSCLFFIVGMRSNHI